MNIILIKVNNFFSSLIDIGEKLTKFVPIDLSVSNLDLKNHPIASSENWENYINLYLQENKADVAYGGYLEERNLYDRSAYFNDKSKADKRNIHLGLDFWCSEGTRVKSPFDGIVHSFKNNTNHGDYGPTIILEHQIKNKTFYSLYGHLSLESLSNKSVGQKIVKGDIVGYLGSSKVNGDYAPHLHFQIIINIEKYEGDYPGVCSINTLEFHKNNCPNPEVYLKKKCPK